MKTIFTPTLFFLLFFYPAYSQVNLKLQSNYQFFNSTSGLKQNSVKFIISDPEKFIWIGTEFGLYKFDGESIKEFHEETNFGVQNKRFVNLGLGFNNPKKLYFFTYPEDNAYEKNLKLSSPVFPCKSDMIFVYQGITYDLSDSSLSFVSRSFNYFQILCDYSKTARKKALYVDGRFYLCADESLAIFQKGKVPIKIKIPNLSNKIAMQFGDTLLFVGNGVTTIYKGKVVSNPKFDKLFSKISNNELGDNLNSQIIGNNSKYFLVNGDSVFSISLTKNGVETIFKLISPYSDISSILYLENDKVFIVGTFTNGFYLFHEPKFNTITLNKKFGMPLINSNYAAISFKPNQILGANGWKYNAISNSVQSGQIPLQENTKRFLLLIKGNIFQNQDNHLMEIGQVENQINLLGGVWTNYVKSSTRFGGRVWLCSEHNIGYLKNNQIIGIKRLDKFFTGRYIEDIEALNNDVLLIATSSGVYTYDRFTKKIGTISGLNGVSTRYLRVEDNGDFWVGCYGSGLYLYSKGIVYKYFDKNIELKTVHSIQCDNFGNFWISSNDGLFKIRKSKLVHFCKTGVAGELYQYTVFDGLPSNEFNGGCKPSSVKLYNGFLGFPNIAGYVVFNPAKLKNYNFGGKISIESIVVEKKEIYVEDLNEINLTSDINSFGVNISYPYFHNLNNLTSEYRLLPYDTGWITFHHRNLEIHKIEPGNYILQIRIRTHGSENLMSEIVEKKIYFEPRFNETLIFKISVVIGLFIVFMVIFSITIITNKRREISLEKTVEAKTIELNSLIIDLETTIRKKEILQKSRDYLFMLIAHDLKSPINNFFGISKTIDFLYEQKDFERLKEIFQNIDVAGKNISNLINNLLFWGLNEQNLLELHLQKININEIIFPIESVYSQVAKYRYVKLEIINLLPNGIFSDKLSLELILRNLVDNSVKFSKVNSTVNIKLSMVNFSYFIEVENSINTGDKLIQEKIDLLNQIVIEEKFVLPGQYNLGLGIIMTINCVFKLGGKINFQVIENIFRVQVLLPNCELP